MSEMFLTAQEIYERITNGPGADALNDAQRISYQEADREADRAARIGRIGRVIQSGWQGSAADGAYGAAAPLADAALQGADNLNRAQDLLDRQSGSFQRAANSVVPVPAGPPEMDVGDLLNPVDHEAQVRQYQADAEHNMQVFEGYDNASRYNEINAPRGYQVVSHSGGTISVTGGDQAGGGDAESGRGGGGVGGPGGGGPSGVGSPGGGGAALGGGHPGGGQPGASAGAAGPTTGLPVGGYAGGGEGRGGSAPGSRGGVAGARVGAGALGAAPVGGGRGKNDDAEHDREYLVEVDAEERFGSEVLTAPRVIGDHEDEDD